MRKYLTYFVIIILALFVFSIKFYLIYQKNENRFFISSKVAGRIVDVYGSSGGERFRLNNSDHIYVLISKTNQLNGYMAFSDVAKIGDSVFKKAFSDTLTLFIKSYIVYKYDIKFK